MLKISIRENEFGDYSFEITSTSLGGYAESNDKPFICVFIAAVLINIQFMVQQLSRNKSNNGCWNPWVSDICLIQFTQKEVSRITWIYAILYSIFIPIYAHHTGPGLCLVNNQYHGYWDHASWWSHVIISHGIDYVTSGSFCLPWGWISIASSVASTWRVDDNHIRASHHCKHTMLCQCYHNDVRDECQR